MAHPLKVGISFTSGPGVLLERPELAALVGSICADWTSVENGLASFYGHLMGVYLPSDPEYEPAFHPIALQVFDEVQTIHSRVQLVKKLAEWVIKDDDLKKDTLSVLDKTKNAGKGRNTVAHAVWGICKEEPEALIMTPNFGHNLIYKKHDFETIAASIKDSKSEIGRVHHEFYKKRKEQS
jgi:hypothetical protein